MGRPEAWFRFAKLNPPALLHFLHALPFSQQATIVPPLLYFIKKQTTLVLLALMQRVRAAYSWLPRLTKLEYLSLVTPVLPLSILPTSLTALELLRTHTVIQDLPQATQEEQQQKQQQPKRQQRRRRGDAAAQPKQQQQQQLQQKDVSVQPAEGMTCAVSPTATTAEEKGKASVLPRTTRAAAKQAHSQETILPPNSGTSEHSRGKREESNEQAGGGGFDVGGAPRKAWRRGKAEKSGGGDRRRASSLPSYLSKTGIADPEAADPGASREQGGGEGISSSAPPPPPPPLSPSVLPRLRSLKLLTVAPSSNLPDGQNRR